MCSSWGHRLRVIEAVDALEAVGGGVADGVEPAAAAGVVVPALGEAALGVVTEEDVVRPLLVGERGRVLRVGDVGLAAVVELGLLAGAAPRACDELHGNSLIPEAGLSGPRRRRRARRRAPP